MPNVVRIPTSTPVSLAKINRFALDSRRGSASSKDTRERVRGEKTPLDRSLSGGHCPVRPGTLLPLPPALSGVSRPLVRGAGDAVVAVSLFLSVSLIQFSCAEDTPANGVSQRTEERSGGEAWQADPAPAAPAARVLEPCCAGGRPEPRGGGHGSCADVHSPGQSHLCFGSCLAGARAQRLQLTGRGAQGSRLLPREAPPAPWASQREARGEASQLLPEPSHLALGGI